MGRIVLDGTYRYSYDSLGQLITVTDNAGHTVESYVYDGAGNILSAVKNGTTYTYGYGDTEWTDLLTSYDGQSITYDAIGNPTGYLGNTLTWQNGRELATFTNSQYSISYSYDVNGLRTEKAVTQSGVTTNYQYFYSGTTLLQERIGSNTILNFIYTADGKPYALAYSTNNGTSYTTYYYLTNLQGDVISILNSSGTAVVTYSYDSWGKITQTTGTLAATLGKDNPLRYRGYVFDEETSLYYLQSRYYDPQTCRFINADSYASTGQGLLGSNMFAYCNNNPVNLFDSHGNDAAEAIILTGPAWAAFEIWLSTIAAVNWWNVLGWTAAAILATGIIVATVYYVYLSTCNDVDVIEVESDISISNPSPPNWNGNDDKDDKEEPDQYEDYDEQYDRTTSRQRVGRSNGNRPRCNRDQNRQIDFLVRRYNLSRAGREYLHSLVRLDPSGFANLVEIAESLVELGGKYVR